MHDESKFYARCYSVCDLDDGDDDGVVGRGAEWSRRSVRYVIEVWIRFATAGEIGDKTSPG